MGGRGGLNLLLDTHALLWWFKGDERLSLTAREAILECDGTVYTSAVSAYELALKYRLGKLPEAKELVLRYHFQISEQGFAYLALDAGHALRAGLLETEHRDPFDRQLFAQAQMHDLILVSKDQAADEPSLHVRRLW